MRVSCKYYPILLLCGMTLLVPGWQDVSHSAELPAENYVSLWKEVASAVMDFSLVLWEGPDAIGQPSDLKAQVPHLKQHRDRVDTAVATLVRSLPPSQELFFHWTMLPLHEELVAAMTVITIGAAAGDSQTVATGYDWMRLTLSTIEQVNVQSGLGK